MPKYRMGELLWEGHKLTCAQGTVWPPGRIKVHGSAEEARPHVTEEEYQRLQVYEKVCGLNQMAELKCLTCPQLVVDGVPVSKPGIGGVKPRSMIQFEKLVRSTRR